MMIASKNNKSLVFLTFTVCLLSTVYASDEGFLERIDSNTIVTNSPDILKELF